MKLKRVLLPLALGLLQVTSGAEAYSLNPREGHNGTIPVAWPSLWVPDGLGLPPLQVVPVSVNGAHWSAESIAALQRASEAWNEQMFLIHLNVVAEQNINIDLSTDTPVLALGKRSAEGGRPENVDRISVYYVSTELDEALERANPNWRAGALGQGSNRGPFPSLSAGVSPPACDFGFVYFYGERKRATNSDLKLVEDVGLSESVLRHELGHVLGLDHSSIRAALMWQSVNGEYLRETPPSLVQPLTLDDIQGVAAATGSIQQDDEAGLAFSLNETDGPCPAPDPAYPGCWPKIDRALVEVFLADDIAAGPIVSGITGWSCSSFPPFFDPYSGNIVRGFVNFERMPTNQNLAIRFAPIDEAFLKDNSISEMADFSYPAFDGEWWFNASDGEHARHARLDPHTNLGVGDAVGIDGDRDGIANLQETSQFRTDPSIPDTDTDGKLDGNEVSLETPPLNACPVAVITAPAEVECTGGGSAQVTLDAGSSHDRENDPMTFVWRGAFPEGDGRLDGSRVTVTLPVGVSDVQLEAHDPYDVSAPVRRSIRVVDTEPPQITIFLSPTELWPPNHSLIPIAATVKVSDLCDSNALFELVSIKSNQLANGRGDGNTDSDIEDAAYGQADTNFRLRAERAGSGAVRTYTVLYRARDHSGNSATAEAVVRVSHGHDGVAAVATDPVDEVEHTDLTPSAAGSSTSASLPAVTQLTAVYPLAISGEAQIEFALASEADARLSVYDVRGVRVQTLRNGRFPAGLYQDRWDGQNDQRIQVPRGVYFVQLLAGPYRGARKLILMRR